MANIPAPIKDIQFIADEVLDLTSHYKKLGVHEDIDAETFMTIIEEASKFLHENAGPLNRNADEQGCRHEGNSVTTPDGFKALYKEFCESGWGAEHILLSWLVQLPGPHTWRQRIDCSFRF